MDKIELCDKIKKVVRKLVLFDGQQITGISGTGTIISSDGVLLTANHVVAPLTKLAQPRVVAYGMEDIPVLEYRPLLMDVALNINMPEYMKPLSIDLAILEPLIPGENLEYLELNNEIAKEGTNVLMAGFPDEISPPLHFDTIINFDNPDLAKEKERVLVFMQTFMRFLMIKAGMIGSIQKTNVSGKFQGPRHELPISAQGAVYWIDNTSNPGASGGPLVDFSGKLVGIICERGSTKQKISEGLTLKVPSGATMAISHQLITWGLALRT